MRMLDEKGDEKRQDFPVDQLKLLERPAARDLVFRNPAVLMDAGRAVRVDRDSGPPFRRVSQRDYRAGALTASLPLNFTSSPRSASLLAASAYRRKARRTAGRRLLFSSCRAKYQ